MLFRLNSSRGVAIAFSSGRGYIVIVLKGGEGGGKKFVPPSGIFEINTGFFN